MEKAENLETLVDVTIIAEFLNLTTDMVRKRVRQNAIPFRRLGNTARPRVRFYKSEVKRWMDGASLKVIDNGVTIIKGDN